MSKTRTKEARRAKTPEPAEQKGVPEVKGGILQTFRLRAQPESEVYVAGTFNDWDPKRHRLTNTDDGVLSTTLSLPRGIHEYKFVVDGIWCLDPSCAETAPNDCGSTNSVLRLE